MKKILLSFITFFLLLSSINAFTINSEDSNEREYFSLSDSVVRIENSNLENFTIFYEINSENKNKTYTLESCQNIYCLEFDIKDLIDTTNSTLSFSTTFEIELNSESKFFYLDLNKPTITLNSYLVNSTTDLLEINFSYLDDSNKFGDVELYIKNDSTLHFQEKLSKEFVTINLTKQGDLTFVIRVYDEAQNYKDLEKTITIEDIFEPVIEEIFFILKDSKYEVKFTIKDDNLDSYQFKQNNLTFNEDISGKSITKTTQIPFTKGNVEFIVKDKNENKVIKILKLGDNDLSISSVSKYSNEDEFTFNSNAQSCYLSSVDSNSVNTKFSKSGTKFSVDLSVSKFKYVDVEFYCDKNGLRKYFEYEFFYDTQNPDEISLDIEANEDGEIDLEWSESEDEHLDVKYQLFRDDEKIYEGSKLKYSDDEVEWGNSYEYFVRVIDLAGNYENSDELEIEPIKVDISFYLITQNNQEVNSDLFQVQGVTDKGSNVVAKVTNSNNLVESKEIKNLNSEEFEFNLRLQSGVNQIQITVEDDFGNSKSKTIYITYSKEINTQSIIEEVEEEVNSIQEEIKEEVEVVKENIISEAVDEVDEIEEDRSYTWIWLIFILFLALLFVFYILTTENELREKFSRKSRKVQDKFSKSRKQDLILGKNLQKARYERIRKQNEERERKRREEELAKKKKESEYQKQKLMELSQKREINIPQTQRDKAKKRVDKIKKETSYEEEL